MENLMDEDVLRIENSAKKKEYQRTKEELRGRELENKRVVARRRADAKKLLRVKLIGTLVITSVVLGGLAYSNAKDRLVRQRGGRIETHPRTGFSTVVGVEEPTAAEVFKFMFEDIKNELGKGR